MEVRLEQEIVWLSMEQMLRLFGKNCTTFEDISSISMKKGSLWRPILKNGFKEICKDKKGCLPYATFQFGAVKFPARVNNSETLYL